MKHRHGTALSDTQLILLSAASQRDDNLLTPSPRLRGSAASRVSDSLIASGLVEEARVSIDQPSWREDPEHGRIGLRITPAGHEAIGLCFAEHGGAASSNLDIGRTEGERVIEPDAPLATVMRIGSKKALVLALLQRDEGAFLDDLIAATGWLAHTTRAALTGLRQSGVTIERTRNLDGRSVYRAVSTPGEAS